SGTNCYDLTVPGQNPKLGIHHPAGSQGFPVWFGNAAAFTQPCALGFTDPADPAGTTTPIAGSPANCVPLNGFGALRGGQATTVGPGFRRLDFSLFKDFQVTERFRLQFRSEFFNILNHPNFNAPGFGGNGVVAVSGATDYTNANFGYIGS